MDGWDLQIYDESFALKKMELFMADSNLPNLWWSLMLATLVNNILHTFMNTPDRIHISI